MPKRSQIHLATVLAAVGLMSCWSQRALVVPSIVEEISGSSGPQVAAPKAETWRIANRPEGSVCHGVISVTEFLNAIMRLLATKGTSSANNRFAKKPNERSSTQLSRLSLIPNDVTKVRLQLNQHTSLTSVDDAPMTTAKPGSARDRADKWKATEAVQVMGSLTEKDLRKLLRNTASRRKGNRATQGRDRGDSSAMKTRQRHPVNTSPLDDNLRKLSTPPVKDISVVMISGGHAVNSEPIVFAPGMNVNNALTQAAISFEHDAAGDINPFECDIIRSRRLLCYVIKECAANMTDQWHHWNIKVKDARGEVVSQGVCMPSSPLKPGYSVYFLYANTQTV